MIEAQAASYPAAALKTAQIFSQRADFIGRQAFRNLLHLGIVVGPLAFLEQCQLRLDVQRVLAGDAWQRCRAGAVVAMTFAARFQPPGRIALANSFSPSARISA